MRWRLLLVAYPDTLVDGGLDNLQAVEGLQDLQLSWWIGNVMRLVC